jgi:uncharacterized integral membrane protein
MVQHSIWILIIKNNNKNELKYFNVYISFILIVIIILIRRGLIVFGIFNIFLFFKNGIYS